MPPVQSLRPSTHDSTPDALFGKKLDVLVDMAARNADAVRYPDLVETIRHHRDGIVESSRVIARRIDTIGRRDAGQQDPLQRDIHKNCG